MLAKVKWYLVALVVNLGFLTALPPKERLSDGQAFRIGSPLNTDQHIESEGYTVETHHAITEDGYILKMHRIPYGKGQEASNQSRTPVFLMHGLTSASIAYIALGSEYSMGYNLADAGYDVWMGNARGNKDSRSHVTLDPDDSTETLEFFDFTWEQIGMIDVPTMIDYVLEVTGHEKLHYIGHSQGGTVFLVLNSMRPEYNEKFLSAHLLAGVGYMEHFPNELLTTLAQQTDIIYALALQMEFVELFPPNFTIPDLPDDLELPDGFPLPRSASDCFTTTNYEAMCDAIGLRNDTGIDLGDLDLDELLEGFGGAAVKQFAHYGQNIRDKLFRRWNFGTAGNLEAYGTEEPPLYDISLITVNVTMHYTIADILLDEQDVLNMARDMPNTVVRKVAREDFSHSDFAAALDAKELVTNFIISEIDLVESARLEVQTDSSTIASLSLFLQLFIVISSLHLLN